MPSSSPPDQPARGTARAVVFRVLVLGVGGIALAFASAFLPPAAARAGPWLMAVATPVTLFAMMLLGAVRGDRGPGLPWWPFALVFLLVTGGFLLALGLPAESADARLWLGLPARAAVVLYGTGLLPLFVLPLVYAFTFESCTLSDDDIARVRAAARAMTRP